jgi:phospholipid transport system substrate-binding protein
MIKKLTVLFFGFILNISFINIALSIEADIFVQSTVNRAADTLGGDLSKEERVEELKKLQKKQWISMVLVCTH